MEKKTITTTVIFLLCRKRKVKNKIHKTFARVTIKTSSHAFIRTFRRKFIAHSKNKVSNDYYPNIIRPGTQGLDFRSFRVETNTDVEHDIQCTKGIFPRMFTATEQCARGRSEIKRNIV